MTCLLVGAMVIGLSSPAFSLHWTHSVEKIEWAEEWQVEDDGLRLVTARVKGSGAGMEPADDAVLTDGWWVWHPGTLVPELNLAASGTTGAGWSLCDGSSCRELGSRPGTALRVAPCAP